MKHYQSDSLHHQFSLIITILSVSDETTNPVLHTTQQELFHKAPYNNLKTLLPENKQNKKISRYFKTKSVEQKFKTQIKRMTAMNDCQQKKIYFIELFYICILIHKNNLHLHILFFLSYNHLNHIHIPYKNHSKILHLLHILKNN